jgi:hypothetical protein
VTGGALDVDGVLVATEQWFVRRGLPHFVVREKSSSDVWARVVPLAAFVFFLEIAVVAPNKEYAVLESIGAVIAGFGGVLLAWMVLNRLRHRPVLSLPDRIGPVEVLLFVLGPALVPIVFGGQWRTGAITAGVNAVLLAAVYLVQDFGLVPMTRWSLGRFGAQLKTMSGLIVRALPLLLVVIVLVFYTNELWQVAHELAWEVLALAIVLLVGVGLLFASIRAPRQIDELEADESWDATSTRVAGTPAEPLLPRMPAAVAPRPLSDRERRNVGLVVVVSEAVVIVLVAAALSIFFVVLGLFTAPPSVVGNWIGTAPDELVTITLFGEQLAITTELLKVSAFLAAFAGLQFCVALLSDRAYQDEFLGDLRDQVADSLAVRVVYLETVEPAPA